MRRPSNASCVSIPENVSRPPFRPFSVVRPFGTLKVPHAWEPGAEIVNSCTAPDEGRPAGRPYADMRRGLGFHPCWSGPAPAAGEGRKIFRPYGRPFFGTGCPCPFGGATHASFPALRFNHAAPEPSPPAHARGRRSPSALRPFGGLTNRVQGRAPFRRSAHGEATRRPVRLRVPWRGARPPWRRAASASSPCRRRRPIRSSG